MPEDEPIEHPADVPASTDSAPESHAPEISMEQPALRGIAPLWHTLVLVLAILAYSVWGAVGAHSGVSNSAAPPSGAAQSQTHGADHGRLIRYALTGALELALVLWVAFGLRLRKIPFRSLFGVWPKGLNGITMEILIAAAFWVCSMIILLVFALSWFAVQNRIYNHETARQPAASSQSSVKPESPEQKQTELIKQLTELAPANGLEIAAWGVLCLVVGFSEELIFRGYLQVQGIALLRNLPLGVLVTAIVFGAAHGYQGVRGIFLISIYGSLFGILTLLRRNLFPGMLAHSWLTSLWACFSHLFVRNHNYWNTRSTRQNRTRSRCNTASQIFLLTHIERESIPSSIAADISELQSIHSPGRIGHQQAASITQATAKGTRIASPLLCNFTQQS